MNKPKVKLLVYTPEPDKIVAAAAKLCYSKTNAFDILEGLDEENTNKFLNKLVEMGHESPIEHVSFTFSIEGISRACSHQLVRHRIGSYSQQSQRYVKLEQFEYIIPPSIEKDEKIKEKYIEFMEEIQYKYDYFTKELIKKYCDEYVNKNLPKFKDILVEDYYSFFKENGLLKVYKEIEKKSIEDARYVFPNACETKIVVTMNARSLMNFFRHRCCQRAQWEIRELANEMLKQVKEVAPVLFKYAGPSCITGVCPEGEMSCLNSSLK